MASSPSPLPYYASGEWSRVLPADTVNVGDIVIQRSISQVFKDEASPSKAAVTPEKETLLPKSKKLDEVLKRLEALENHYKAEDTRLNNARVEVQTILKKVGCPNSTQTGASIQGLFQGGLKENVSLLCQCLSFVDMKSRSSLLVSSKDIKKVFAGPQVVVSSQYRPNNAPPLELLSQQLYSLSDDKASSASKVTTPEITFLARKDNVKVISLKKNDEVFFRPCLLNSKYDSDQDWPRGRVKQVRESDGVIVIQTWSWRLAGGNGATIYAQWNDVRRAGTRTRFQMLPEQRVWRAQELKEEATLLFTAALKEEKIQTDWAACKKALSTETCSKAMKESPSKTPKSPTAASSADKPSDKKLTSPKKEKAPLLNSMFVLLNPKVSAKEKAIDFVRSTFMEKGKNGTLKIAQEGKVTSEIIAKSDVIDSHFSSLSQKAYKLKPSALDILPKQRELFEKEFGVKWFDALKNGSIVNAKQLEQQIEKENKKNNQNSKQDEDKASMEISLQNMLNDAKEKQFPALWLGKGFHVSKVELPISPNGSKEATLSSRYVVNGFYPSMKAKYHAANTHVHYFVVEWNPLLVDDGSLDWKTFQETTCQVIRKEFSTLDENKQDEEKQDLNKYGFEADANVQGDDGLIYVSSSPLVALIDKANWLPLAKQDTNATNDNTKNYSYSSDKFGAAILGGSLNETLLKTWRSNPPINFENLQNVCVFDHVQGLNADPCSLKVKAMVSDAYGKLEAAKQRYIEAVGFVDGDDIYDPDIDRRAKIAPCSGVLASIADLKVSMFTNIALCCRKLIAASDRITSNNKMMSGDFKTMRGLQSKQLIDHASRAAKIVDMLALRGTHARPIVKHLMKKHEEAKFFGQMRCKALYLAAWAYADSESPSYDLEVSLEILKRARNELASFAAPKLPKTDPISPSLRKLLEAQKKEIETLMRKLTDTRKRQQAAGKKRWSAAFEKNAKDPEAGLPPPKQGSNPSPVDVAEQAKLEQAFMNEGIKMPDGSILGGANLMGGSKASPFMSEIKPNTTTSAIHSPAGGNQSAASQQKKQLLAQYNDEEEEHEDHEDDSLTEHLLGAAAIAGVAAAVGFGLMWLKKKT